MRYEIQGDTLPVVICYLDGGEKMITEKGAMSWMSPNMHMATSTNGGIGKAFGRMFSGESMFQNIYTAQGGPGMIAFASCFPGSILPYQISPGRELIVQKSGFLASEAGVNLSVFFQKRFGSGLFGGEGFIMQRLAGEGMVFLEFDGHVVEYDLQPGQQIIVDTGYLDIHGSHLFHGYPDRSRCEKYAFWRGRHLQHRHHRPGTYMAPDHADLECSRSDLTVYSVKVLIRRIYFPDCTGNLTHPCLERV